MIVQLINSLVIAIFSVLMTLNHASAQNGEMSLEYVDYFYIQQDALDSLLIVPLSKEQPISKAARISAHDEVRLDGASSPTRISYHNNFGILISPSDPSHIEFTIITTMKYDKRGFRYLGARGKERSHQIDYNIQSLGKNVYRLTPLNPLSNGEYCIIYNRMIFSFSIFHSEKD